MEEGLVKFKRSTMGNLVESLRVSSTLPEVRSTELITARDYEDCRTERPIELKVLRCAYSNLVESLSVSSILPEARSTELITVRDYEDCRAERTDSRQAEKLIECVERAVTVDPEKFNSFLSILEHCQQQGIADYLRTLKRSMMLAKIQQPGELYKYQLQPAWVDFLTEAVLKCIRYVQSLMMSRTEYY